MNFCNGKEVFLVEIYWVFYVIDKYYFFKSCDIVGDLFRNMFLDSVVVFRFFCGEKKCVYFFIFGICFYF